MKTLSKIVFGLVTAWLVLQLTGCGLGSRIGPSDEKVRLDYEEHIQLMGLFSRSSMKIKSFEIVNREVLSEDRVKFHLVVSVGKIPEKVTLLYQLVEGGVWKMTSNEMGHQ